MSGLVVIGVDPGGRYTGLVARRGDECLQWRNVDLGSDWADLPNAHGANQLQAALVDLCTSISLPDELLVGVEDVNAPTPHMGTVTLAGLVKTAFYAGSLYKIAAALDLDAVMVPPGGNGDDPPQTYPHRLRARRPDWTIGRKVVAHLYSAWDVSHAAPTLHRYETAAR